MTDAPWTGDACSLVDAFRAGERSPVEELDATFAAIEASKLNCFSYLDREGRAPIGRDCRPLETVRGGAHGHQGARTRQGLALHRGLARVPGSHRRPNVPSHRAVARARRGRPGRSHDGKRVRGPQRFGHQAERCHPQPVAARPHRRWFLERFGGSSGRRDREPRDGRRRRWFDPHSRGVHRPARIQGHVRSDPAQPARVHAAEHGGRRQSVAIGTRLGSLSRCVRGSAPRRSHVVAGVRRVGIPTGDARPAGPAGRRSSRASAACPSNRESRIACARRRRNCWPRPGWCRPTYGSSRPT